MDQRIDRRLDQIEEGLKIELQAFLGGNLFSGYAERAKLRSDDVAVRSRASAEILEGKAHLARTIGEWSDANVAPSTREAPLAPPAITAKLQRLRAYERTLGDVETSIRSAVAPDFDAVWQRTRDGNRALQRLLELDLALIQDAIATRDALLALDAPALSTDHPFAAADATASKLTRLLAERTAFLRYGE